MHFAAEVSLSAACGPGPSWGVDTIQGVRTASSHCNTLLEPSNLQERL